MNLSRWTVCLFFTGVALARVAAGGEELAVVAVEGQPLAANVARLLDALQQLGMPLPAESEGKLRAAVRGCDASEIQKLLDPFVLFEVSVKSDRYVSVDPGPAPARLQQAGYMPILVKVLNPSSVDTRLRVGSEQSGPIYAGVAELSMKRQQQERLRENANVERRSDRFLDLELYDAPPMTERLSGLEVEYVIMLIFSSEFGKREAEIEVDVERIEKGLSGLGIRGAISVVFEIAKAVPVELSIHDADGRPTMARLLFRDAVGHVFPPQIKRLAPDLFFQPHIYRADGESVLLPPGDFQVEYSRGPEYVVKHEKLHIAATDAANPVPVRLAVNLERWIDTAAYGFYSGDHHIHAAGCAHYTSPTEGVTPEDMFRQVKGEGLNVGCVLTWGPCFTFQRQFFTPTVDKVSDDQTILKYDLEISGFGSQALGHVCLLNLKDQTYPGSMGTSTQGWPTWTTPVMKWAKEQGGYAGYAHSASGMHIDPAAAAKRLLEEGDRDQDKQLSRLECDAVFLPAEFAVIDADHDEQATERELTAAINGEADRLPNYVIPEMNGVGAMEIVVSSVHNACDFISAMDTARIQEWNTWYHLLNCGFPIKVSGETDFPCMSSRNVGQGRVYVQLGREKRLDFAEWCANLAAGRSYVSDGYAHPVQFTVEGNSPGPESVMLSEPAEVEIKAQVAFATATPLAVAHGGITPATGKRVVGDTVLLHGERSAEWQVGGERVVELIINGESVESARVPADGQVHDLQWRVRIDRSSWVALRHFPQFHTNPVNVLVAGAPIRASQRSALWCYEATELLWKNRRDAIASAERAEAEAAFSKALEFYRKLSNVPR